MKTGRWEKRNDKLWWLVCNEDQKIMERVIRNADGSWDAYFTLEAAQRYAEEMWRIHILDAAEIAAQTEVDNITS